MINTRYAVYLFSQTNDSNQDIIRLSKYFFGITSSNKIFDDLKQLSCNELDDIIILSSKSDLYTDKNNLIVYFNFRQDLFKRFHFNFDCNNNMFEMKRFH